MPNGKILSDLVQLELTEGERMFFVSNFSARIELQRSVEPEGQIEDREEDLGYGELFDVNLLIHKELVGYLGQLVEVSEEILSLCRVEKDILQGVGVVKEESYADSCSDPVIGGVVTLTFLDLPQFFGVFDVDLVLRQFYVLFSLGCAEKAENSQNDDDKEVANNLALEYHTRGFSLV